tara:strand:+ start:515 stop:754 length:240 start_codon:yes stop_codon:yes gene_type:complete
MDDEHIADIWLTLKEYIDKKHIEMAAERYVDLMADYGVTDEQFNDLLGNDKNLDQAITYYLDMNDYDEDYDDDEYDEDY